MRYDEAADLYFDWSGERKEQRKTEAPFRLSIGQMHRLTDELRENGLNCDILGLLDFIKGAIEGREYGKFVFTKSLSKAIQLIGEVGGYYGFSREDCAFLDIQAVRNLYSTTGDVGNIFKKSIDAGKEGYEMTKTITLPPIILKPEDVWHFDYPEMVPNYITMHSAGGEVVVLEEEIDNFDISDKIVMIRSADPGYDWIFSHHVKGFITMYGGANSHMAIRAGELGIPAAIGVGEKKFRQYQKAHYLEINASAKTVRAIS